MAHAGHHEEAVEVLHAGQPGRVVASFAQGLHHPFEVVDAAERRDVRVAPPVIHQQLATAVAEATEIGVVGVEGVAGLGQRDRQIPFVVP